MTHTIKLNLITQLNWLRGFSALAVIWYLFGFSQLVKNITMDISTAIASGAITKAHGAAILATPDLIWASYFLACLLGLLGAIQLFRNHSSAFVLFGFSLILDVIYFGWFYVSGTASARPTESGIIAIIVITIATVLTLLSIYSNNQETKL